MASSDRSHQGTQIDLSAVDSGGSAKAHFHIAITKLDVKDITYVISEWIRQASGSLIMCTEKS